MFTLNSIYSSFMIAMWKRFAKQVKLQWGTWNNHLTWKRLTAPLYIPLSPTRYKSSRKSLGEAQSKKSLKRPSTHSLLPKRTSMSWGSKEDCKEGTSILGRRKTAEAGKCREIQGAEKRVIKSREDVTRKQEVTKDTWTSETGGKPFNFIFFFSLEGTNCCK